MSGVRRRDTPEWAWEQALIDAYDDYRWHQVLDPLAVAVRRWEAGDLDHVDLARAAERVRKGMSPIDYIFSEKRDGLGHMTLDVGGKLSFGIQMRRNAGTASQR